MVELQKPRNLSAHESEECEHGEGVGVYEPYGRAKAGTRPVGVELRKKPKDLSASESEERGHGEGGGVYASLLQPDTLLLANGPMEASGIHSKRAVARRITLGS